MFSPATDRWFADAFDEPTEVQRRGWEAIARGEHALLVAPTGSGKTLAAFLAGIDRVSQSTDGEPGVRVVYVSPLKALVHDVERNLRAPLVGIARAAEQLGAPARPIEVGIRTGDTTQRERSRQLRHPPEILVTTPESLYLLLGSRARANFSRVHTVIVDEIHAIAPSKRGVHLAVTLERLSELTERDPQRVGLSATVRPLDEIGRFLGGDRPVTIVDTSSPPNLDLQVTVPVPDMENPTTAPSATAASPGNEKDDTKEPYRPGGAILGELYDRNLGIGQREQGVWPAIYPVVLETIRASRSTIVFVNNRGLCERLAQRLNELAEEPLVRAHHGSVSHEQRSEIEEGLKSGQIRGIVATSSLELGIDMGTVDRVLLIESPRSVARGLQRVGRAGHQVGAISVGRIFPKFRGDLLECAVIAGRMIRGEIEAIQVPQNALDVLAQQITAMCCDAERTVDEVARLVRRAHPYRTITDGAIESVLDMLSGRYPSSDFADLRPLLAWDRTANRLSARRGTATIMHMNAGTIPDRGAFAVHLVGGGPRLGELDEEMVYETRVGDNIMLGATTWRVEEVNRNQVLVSPAPGEPGRLPFWRGDGPGRPLELGRALGRFVAEVGEREPEAARALVQSSTPLDELAARNLVNYVHEQKAHTTTLPTDRRITIERFRDEIGDWRVCLLTPFGSRVHAPWAMAIQRRATTVAGFEIQVMYTDDGIVLRFADGEEQPDLDLLIPGPDELEDLVTEQLGDSALFAGLFRENSVRALLMTRRRPDQRTPLWVQRVKSQNLMATVRQFSTFPVVLETYRHALRDVFDLPATVEVLTDIRSRRIHVDEVETPSASPFARSLVFAYVAAYIYEQDSPIAERRAQALTLDRQLLGELLGQAELRELLDAEAIADTEAALQGIAPEWHARDADELHDLLRRVGDLGLDEARLRTTEDPAPWFDALEQQRRAARVRLAIEPRDRWIAAEEAGLYRDALGVVPPSGLPETFLASVEQPIVEILRRFARTHGPFLTEDVVSRYGLRAEEVETTLKALAAAGTLVRGEIMPGGAEPEWCDAEVLRRIKRQTLARLRGEVAPVDDRAFGRFLPQWHGVGDPRSGQDGLLEALLQLEGLPLSFEELTSIILPARVKSFSLDMLDLLAASGRIVWIGHGLANPRDGRIAIYRRERIAALLPTRDPTTEKETTTEKDAAEAPDDAQPLSSVILEALASRGASFQFELLEHVRRKRPITTEREFTDALWDLVWDGRVTNDTFGPLQTFGWSPKRGGRARRSRGPAFTAGRWSTVESLLHETTDTERAVARAELLLERYGVACRRAAEADSLPGGFSGVYRVLQAMEDAGKLRRGYFVEGINGAQFARAGVVDRLRAVRSDTKEAGKKLTANDVLFLAAADPANPYGTLLPWPATTDGESGSGRPRRAVGCWVVLVRGAAALFVGSRGRQILTFAESNNAEGNRAVLDHAFAHLHRLPRGNQRGRLTVEKIDRTTVRESVHGDTLLAHNFESTYRGYAATT